MLYLLKKVIFKSSNKFDQDLLKNAVILKKIVIGGKLQTESFHLVNYHLNYRVFYNHTLLGLDSQCALKISDHCSSNNCPIKLVSFTRSQWHAITAVAIIWNVIDPSNMRAVCKYCPHAYNYISGIRTTTY